MPAHLRDRFKKSKQQSKIRKQSKSHEESLEKEPPPELPSQQKPLSNSPFLPSKSQGYAKASNKSEVPNDTTSNKPSLPDTSAKSIKDRMKMFSNSTDEPTPPKSPVSQRWPPSNSFEKKQPGISSLGKPPVEDTKQKMLPPKVIPESKKSPIRNDKENLSVPPLPDHNTKPPRFGGSKPGSISKCVPMPLPSTISYDDVSCLCVIFSIH